MAKLGGYIDMLGQRFGRLLVKEHLGVRDFNNRYWQCQCDCGASVAVRGDRLRCGKTTSCGCYRRINAALSFVKHGRHGTPIYRIYGSMLNRCQNVKSKSYRLYGGRGISVCERWMSFENFLADMGERPPGMSLDRIDNDGNYEPGNCRWATDQQQGRNRRTNRILEIEGQALPMVEWAERAGLDYYLVAGRLRRGWSHEKALTTPVRPRGKS